MRLERKGKYMNELKKVSILTGGGGEPLNRVHYGGNPVISHNYWCSRRDNTAVAYRKH